MPLTPAQRAAIAFDRGDYAEAERLASKMTRSHPKNALGWKVLGASLLMMGRPSDALKAVENAAGLLPSDAVAQHDHGIVLCALGRHDEAEAGFRRAIALRPSFPEAYNNLGNLLRLLGRLKEAEDACLKAIEISGGFAVAHSNLGNILRDLGRYLEAEGHYRRAIEINPGYAEAYNNLGAALQDLGRQKEAEGHYRRALEINPGYAEAYNNLGTVFHDLGRWKEAEDHYRCALEINPDYAEAHNNLGTTLQDLGRLQEAEGHYRRAIAISPDHAEYYLNLGLLRSCTRDDSCILQLRRLYEEAKDETNRMHASFALARACEDVGEYDEAFSLYQEGNGLRKKQLDYSIEKDRVLFERIRSVFRDCPEMEPVPLRETNPILIVGMPRSGTSLVEQILASHSMVFGAGELDILNNLVEKHFTEDSGAERAGAIASGFFDELDKVSQGRSHVTDKMPLNFRWLGFVLLANPGVRIIHTMRDPVATCWSIFRLHFPAGGLGFACDLNDIAEYHKLYRDLMKFWHARFPGRIHDLDYEKLTEDQDAETRKLLEYCGLPWEEGCLEFEKSGRVVKTASFAQVRKKLYKSSSQAWRKFEKHLGALQEALGGYD